MNIKQPSITFIYNRRSTASETRKASLELRILYDYQQKYINTSIKLFPHQWNNGIIVNCPDALQLSQILNKLVADVRQALIDMMQEGNINLKNIQQRISRLNSNLTFIQFCEQRATIRKYGRTKDSQERYDRFLRFFTSWGKIVEFSDITEENIIAYDAFLIKTGMKTYSKWNNYHRFLNSFIIDAIDAGFIKKNPYKWVNIDKDKDTEGLEKYLTPDEFKKIQTAPMPFPHLERVRDLFVFQTYTCMSYTDLARFDVNKITEIKGTKVYTDKRKKTKKTYTVPLLPTALDILYKYNKVLPVISNVKYNEYLKRVAKEAGVDKNISSHWARHTGATILLNKGVDMQIVSRVCGHSSIRITEQIYAKLLDETVVDAVTALEGVE